MAKIIVDIGVVGNVCGTCDFRKDEDGYGRHNACCAFDKKLSYDAGLARYRRCPECLAAEVKPEVSPPYSKADVVELVEAVKNENDMTGYDNLKSEQVIRIIRQKKQAVLDALSKFPAKCDDAKREGV